MRVVAGIVAVLLTAPGVRAARDAVSLRANLLSGVSKGCTSTSCPAGKVCVMNTSEESPSPYPYCTACNGAGANCLNSALPCCKVCNSGSYTCG
jgi:hypothetical protein